MNRERPHEGAMDATAVFTVNLHSGVVDVAPDAPSSRRSSWQSIAHGWRDRLIALARELPGNDEAITIRLRDLAPLSHDNSTAHDLALVIMSILDREHWHALHLVVRGGASGALLLAYDLACQALFQEPGLFLLSAMLTYARRFSRGAPYHEAGDPSRSSAWARYYRLRRARACLGMRDACLAPLARLRCRSIAGKPCPYCLLCADHTSLWIGRNGLRVWVTQPYHFTASDALELSRIAHRLVLQTSALPPGHGWHSRDTYWIVVSNRIVPPHTYRYDDSMLSEED